ACLEKSINFTNFRKYCECLLANPFRLRASGTRICACLVPGRRQEGGPNWSRKNTVASRSTKKAPCDPIAGTPAWLIHIEKAYWDIDRDSSKFGMLMKEVSNIRKLFDD